MLENIVPTVEFQMSLLLFVALAGYFLASLVSQSVVVGEIFVGLLIGPSVLGLITYTDFVASVAHIGAIILLFAIGLEFDLEEIFNLKYSFIALVGVIVPWICGFYLAQFFNYSFASSVFVGTALTATSIAITANVLKEMGKLKTPAAKAIIGAAVIDDVLGLLALSIAQQEVHSIFSFSSTALLLLKAAVFIGFGAYIGYRYFSKALVKIDRSPITKKFPEFAFIFAMMAAFFYAMSAELIGLSAIVGAFIAGASLKNTNIKHSRDYKEGAEYLHIIFASIFFVSLGILVDFHAITANILWFLVALTIVAIATKAIGCYIPARLQGMSRKDSAIVGFGMSPRGEVAMIVALIGLNGGIIKQDIYISIVMMSLFTAIITPIVLRNWLYKKT